MRVGAVLSIDNNIAKFLGYGEYLVDEVPDADVGGMGQLLRTLGQKNPKIVLESGQVVWGCECWWGEEDRIKARLAQCSEVIPVDIDALRKELAVGVLPE